MNRIAREGPQPDAARRWRASVGPRRVLLAVALGLATSAAARAQEAEAGDDHEVRSFAIPETSLSRALVEQARGHIAARRWGEAIRALQTLIEEHRGEVLAGRTSDPDGGWRSQQAVHDGAAAQAARL